MARALGDFEKIVLFALLRLGDGAYGVPIHQEIACRIGREVSVGAVYTTLHRLEERGLVSSEMGEATAERGGRRKKLYSLEPAGAKALQQAWSALQLMAEGTRPSLLALSEVTDV